MRDYIITKTSVIVKMEKPLFGTKYYVREKYINLAKRFNKYLVLDTPDGKATYTAKEWMKGADRMEKEFNFPGNPMILWGKHIKVDVDKRKERKKQEKKMGITRIPFETKKQMVKEIVRKNPELARKLGWL